MTLEERYTQAMRLRGYELADTPEDSMETLTFQKAGGGREAVRCDGWRAVGIWLENKPPGESRGLTEQIDGLIHPQGRIKYYAEYPNPYYDLDPVYESEYEVYKTNSFEEALKKYCDEAWEFRGRVSLGVFICEEIDMESGLGSGILAGVEKAFPLTRLEYVENTVLHDMSYVSDPERVDRHLQEAALNELEEIHGNCRKMAEALSRENAHIQVSDSLWELERRAAEDIREGRRTEDGRWNGRVANNSRPQDYIDLGIERVEGRECLFRVTAASVHANEIKREISFQAERDAIIKNLALAFSDSQFEGELRAEVMNLDTDYIPQTPPQEKAFTFYADHAANKLEDHYEKLERAGYDRNPSPGISWGPDETCGSIPNNNKLPPADMQAEKRIEADIRRHGFRAEPGLVRNIARLEELEGRHYSVKELAGLSRKNSGFGNSPEKSECFGKIISEFQSQEAEAAEKPGFLKQEAAAEMAAELA